MKPVNYDHPIGTVYDLVAKYYALIRKVLEERDIYVIIFEEGPVTNPCSRDYFDSYNVLKYENESIMVASSDEITDCTQVFNKEQFENGEFDEMDEIENVSWYDWSEIEENAAHSWACLYEYIRDAINEVADEE